MSKKIITVFGATGAQGGSVVNIFLNDPKLKAEWAVRGVTRDTTKDSSKALASKGVEVVSVSYLDYSYLTQRFTRQKANRPPLRPILETRRRWQLLSRVPLPSSR